MKYSYDPLGQRIKSEEIKADDSGQMADDSKAVKTTTFLMSGIGMVEHARITDNVAQYHTLGLDLAQSLTVTGGVGAVLASTTYKSHLPLSEGQDEGVMSQHYLYDVNANVIATTDSSGAIIAKLAYSPFGKQISGTTNNVPFSFSTKPVDSSELSYYGFRFYNPGIGRWMSRDPIEEAFKKATRCKNGDCLGKEIDLSYGFVNNNPTNHYDLFGLLSNCPSGAKTRNCSGNTCEYRTGDQKKPPAQGNGCGSETSQWVPDDWGKIIDFSDACNDHDQCYMTCGASKVGCDFTLGWDMIAACAQLWYVPPLMLVCQTMGPTYTLAVLALGGPPYEEAQDEYCKWETCCE